jgi:hypothetical protein
MRVVKLLFVAMLVAGCVSAATITTYTDRTAWDAAVSGVTFYTYTEDFDDATFEPWLTITSDWPGSVSGAEWRSRVDSTDPLVDTFAFSAPAVLAWGADLDLPEDLGAGEGIAVWAYLAGGGWTQAGASIDGSYQGFFGFVVSGDHITEVQFRGGGLAATKETYNMNDMSIAGVPEPGTYALTGLGMMALLLLRRRKA